MADNNDIDDDNRPPSTMSVNDAAADNGNVSVSVHPWSAESIMRAIDSEGGGDDDYDMEMGKGGGG